MKKKLTLLCVLAFSIMSFAQEKESNRSIIQEYTPSILLKKGQWDIKWFNILYTETRATFGGNESDRYISVT